MKISIVGCGKLGNAVADVATRSGHEVVYKINSKNLSDLDRINPENTDVIIESSTPENVVSNIIKFIHKKMPIVVATTGWYHKLGDIEELTIQNKTGLVYGANFSIGMNILFKMNRMLSGLMNRFPQYDCYIEEKHHVHKKDAPGGTALRLAHELINDLERKTTIADPGAISENPIKSDELCVSFIRSGNIIGEHSVVFTSSIDEIKISHRAFNREGFALGIIIAANWIQNKTGFFEFNETLI